MASWPKCPVVYEINSAAWLTDLSCAHGSRITLGQVPQSELDRLVEHGIDGVWLMGIWERSVRAREIARDDPVLQAEYKRVLPDYQPQDILGSPFAVRRYEVDPAFGGREELRAFRQRLRSLGVHLLLDFVPNHLAIDHAWLEEHPERLVRASADRLDAEPQNYFKHEAGGLAHVFAHGRDPNYDGWTDTVQLDYRRADTRRAMCDMLGSLATQCDGVRCDMAMLVTRDVFVRTWGGDYEPPDAEFWPEAIKTVRSGHPDFLMLAEVYWDLEYKLQQLGFDHTYDKRLYERLLIGDATGTRAHLRASLDYQQRLTRFIENHDEQRAITAFGQEPSRGAAVGALTLPGMRLVHDGQMEGRTLKLPVQLGRRPFEVTDDKTYAHYSRLLAAIGHQVFHEGHWQLLEPQPVAVGNTTFGNFIGYHWSLGDEQRLVVVNLSANPAQCLLALNFPGMAGSSWQLQDLLSNDQYVRNGDELLAPGLYLDVPGHRSHLFHLHRQSRKS